MRRTRGSSSVELILIMPLVVVLLAGIGYLHSAGMTGLAALHSAETEAWRSAMSNGRSVCIAGSAAGTMVGRREGRWSFAGSSKARQVPRPPPPLPAEWSVADTRSDFMPCPDALVEKDNTLW